MSNPPPSGYQPFGQQPQKRGPSCWAIGGLGCLTVFILGAILMLVGLKNLFDSKAGHQIMSGFNNALKSATAGAACVEPMTEIQKAIVRYHETERKYPDNLDQLRAKYLPVGVSLHCGVDKIDDPKHITYQYMKPSEKSPGSFVVLRYSWDIVTQVESITQVQTMTEQITLDGAVSSTRTKTETTTTTPSPPSAPPPK